MSSAPTAAPSWLDKVTRVAVAAALAFGTSLTSAFAASPTKLTAVDASELPNSVKRPVKYFGDVHPILMEHCVSCHGPKKQKGGLRLDSREAALEGGDSYGPAIVPGKSAESPLLLFTAHLEPDMEMPPEKEKLPEPMLAVLRAWIDQGAIWPAPAGTDNPDRSALGNQELFFKKAATHWAFQPVVKADADSLRNGSSKIDALIDAKLKGKGLERSPRADARTLLKRLHFDVTGLPPSPEEMANFTAAFEKDARAALDAKVDELLASPHFGERWGRYWLDVARYADTQDFFPTPDLRYPFAWTYRDYVVAAFNSDKPYDQFIREQIAADQLGLKPNDPALAALGLLTVGPRFLRRPDEITNDRIDVVTRGMMGLTVVCARCHDHKYDPIPTADFYALHGIFASTEDLTTLPEIELANGKPDPKARAEYEAAKTKAQRAITDFTKDLKEKSIADLLAKPEAYFDAFCEVELKKKDVKKVVGETKLFATALVPLTKQWAALKKDAAAGDDPVLSPLAKTAAAPDAGKAAVIEAVIATGRVPQGKVDLDAAVLAAIRKEQPKDEGALLRTYAKLLDQAKKGPREDLQPVVKAFTREGGLFDFALKDVESAAREVGTKRPDYEKLEKAVADTEATHPGSPPRAMAVKDRATPVKPVIYVRGDPGRRGDAVDRRFLQVLDPKKTAFPADHSGRRELAERIASADNPLTPRVWANHVWRHLMGRPLVKTTGDFGLQSEPPTHPELLDWLASALVQRGWSTKKLVRDILLSASYQQSSADRSAAAAVDVDNNLLWRANRRRMDFEAMRDAMLATSGQLDAAIGGRAVNLSAEPFTGRRTIYGFVDRANPDPLFVTFDFPSPDIANTERAQTLVPQQALFALNDSFIIEQARALARRARESAGGGAGESGAVDWLYRRLFLRPPTVSEVEMGQAFLRETGSLSEARPSGVWSYGYGSADPATPRSQAFQPLSYFDPQAKRYQGGRVFPSPQQGFASLTATGGHPDAGLGKAVIRRWVAPYSGQFTIGGELSMPPKGAGDGVRARVISSKAGLLGEWLVDHGSTNTAKSELTDLKVEAGEILDFVVDCRENTNTDSFRWVPTIKLQAVAAKVTATRQTAWDAQAEFKAPPPPKLQPLEQMAQALLITNEFLFLD